MKIAVATFCRSILMVLVVLAVRRCCKTVLATRLGLEKDCASLLILNFFFPPSFPVCMNQLVMQCLTVISCQLVELSSSGKTIGVFQQSDASGDHCARTTYDTDDPFIKAARYMISLSIVCGVIAGIMIFFECVACEICCAGCLERFALLLASWTSASTFVFYGAEVCQEEEIEELLEEYNWKDLIHNLFEEGDVNFTNQTRDQQEFGCEYTVDSVYMTISSIAYFVCAILLCW